MLNGGLFEQANKASSETDIAQAKELIHMDLLDKIIAKEENITEGEINEVLGRYTSSGKGTKENGEIVFSGDLKTKKRK